MICDKCSKEQYIKKTANVGMTERIISESDVICGCTPSQFVPVLLKDDFSKQIGILQLTEEGLKMVNENSVFSIAYIPRKYNKKKEVTELELLSVSLTTDEDYVGYLLGEEIVKKLKL